MLVRVRVSISSPLYRFPAEGVAQIKMDLEVAYLFKRSRLKLGLSTSNILGKRSLTGVPSQLGF